MDVKSFWNEVSKYGIMLGVVMGALTIFMQSLVINGGVQHAGSVTLIAILYVVLFFVILRVAAKKRAASIDPELGFSYFQGVNYMILVSMFAAVPAACIYYVYINSIVGYDNYIDGLTSILIEAAKLQPLDDSSATLVEDLIEQVRKQPQVSVFALVFNSIIQYAFGGMFVGLILSGFISRKPQKTNGNGDL